MNRVFTAAEQALHQRAAQCVDDAMSHHLAAVNAYDRDDPVGVEEAHAKVHRALRSAQAAFRDMAAAAAEQDIKNSQTIQTSSGTDVSDGSANGRTFADFMARERARIGVRR